MDESKNKRAEMAVAVVAVGISAASLVVSIFNTPPRPMFARLQYSKYWQVSPGITSGGTTNQIIKTHYRMKNVAAVPAEDVCVEFSNLVGGEPRIQVEGAVVSEIRDTGAATKVIIVPTLPPGGEILVSAEIDLPAASPPSEDDLHVMFSGFGGVSHRFGVGREVAKVE